MGRRASGDGGAVGPEASADMLSASLPMVESPLPPSAEVGPSGPSDLARSMMRQRLVGDGDAAAAPEISSPLLSSAAIADLRAERLSPVANRLQSASQQSVHEGSAVRSGQSVGVSLIHGASDAGTSANVPQSRSSPGPGVLAAWASLVSGVSARAAVPKAEKRLAYCIDWRDMRQLRLWAMTCSSFLMAGGPFGDGGAPMDIKKKIGKSRQFLGRKPAGSGLLRAASQRGFSRHPEILRPRFRVSAVECRASYGLPKPVSRSSQPARSQPASRSPPRSEEGSRFVVDALANMSWTREIALSAFGLNSARCPVRSPPRCPTISHSAPVPSPEPALPDLARAAGAVTEFPSAVAAALASMSAPPAPGAIGLCRPSQNSAFHTVALTAVSALEQSPSLPVWACPAT